MNEFEREQFYTIIRKYFLMISDLDLPSISTVQRFREDLLDIALWQTRDNKAKAARLLNIKRTTLVEMEKKRISNGD